MVVWLWQTYDPTRRASDLHIIYLFVCLIIWSAYTSVSSCRMSTGTNCCNVCPLFLSTDDSILLDDSFEDGDIKGYGNANIVRDMTVKGVPLVARVQLCKKDRDSEKHRSSQNDGVLAEIEALMWRRRGHCHLEDGLEYISSILGPELSPRHLPLMVCVFLVLLLDGY